MGNSIARLEKAFWCCVRRRLKRRSSCLRLLKIVCIRASQRPSKINYVAIAKLEEKKKLMLCVIHGLGGITTNKTKAPGTTSGSSIYTTNQLCIKTLAVGNGAARPPSAQQRRTFPCDVHV